MKETITRITTADTEKTYELPGKDVPQLWAITMTVSGVDRGGEVSKYSSIAETLYYERQSFVDVALLPVWRGDKPPPAPPKTLEDMFAEILAHMGIFPTGESL